MLSHVLDESHGDGSGNTREDGDGDNVVVISALTLADADECDDQNVVHDCCVGTSLLGGMRRRWYDNIYCR